MGLSNLEMDEAEKNLLEALRYLDGLMKPELNPDAGKGVTMGLGEFLRKYNCKMVSYLSQVLKDDGYVTQVMQGKNSVIFWNKNEHPNMRMATEIVKKTRSLKTEKTRPPTEKQRNDVIRSLLDEAVQEKLDLEAKIKEKEDIIRFLKTKLDE